MIFMISKLNLRSLACCYGVLEIVEVAKVLTCSINVYSRTPIGAH